MRVAKFAAVSISGIVAALVAPGPAHAQAVQGQLGPTSTGSFGVELTVDPPPPTLVQISGLQDLVLQGSPELIFGLVLVDFDSLPEPFCVYHTTPTVSLEFSSATVDPTGLLQLAGPNDARVQYAIVLNEGLLGIVQRPGTLTGIVGNRTSPSCADGGEIILRISTPEYRDGDLTPGVYSATIQITVRPE